MQQLSGMDSIFLAAESSRTPMHVTPVLLYEAVAADTDPESHFTAIYSHLTNSLNISPIFRRKLKHAPLRDDHSYWIDDEDFDLDNHVHRVALEEPGDWPQFCKTVSHLHATGLDLDRPLWECYVIEGLKDIQCLPQGGYAILLKFHHAAIDGMSGLKIISALHSPTVSGAANPNPEDWQPTKAPATVQMIWNSYKNQMQRPAKFWRTIKSVVPALEKSRSDKKADRVSVQKIKTRFNRRVTSDRVFDSIIFSIDRIQRIRKSVPGATVNDAVVSIVGGGLRRYLNADGDLPKDSLLTGAPINIRNKRNAELKVPDRTDATGNLISMMRIPLRTDIADPVQRLDAIHSAAVRSKENASKIGTGTMTNLAQSIHPQLLALGVRVVSSDLLSDLISSPVHTMVSNVPGPRVDLFMCGARLHSVLGLGPLVDQVGLFHTVTSSKDAMAISFVSCPEMMPNPDFYRECLVETIDEFD